MIDNIMQAIRLLDLDAQPATEVSTKDLVALVNEIQKERQAVRLLRSKVNKLEVTLSNTISDTLSIMAKQTPRLDVRC